MRKLVIALLALSLAALGPASPVSGRQLDEGSDNIRLLSNVPLNGATDLLGDGTNTWDAQWYRGKVYVGDSGRGLDILEITDLER
ncbi:MAG: hypothetical protein ACR2KQ_03080 [Actinomycetota bacterium]